MTKLLNSAFLFLRVVGLIILTSSFFIGCVSEEKKKESEIHLQIGTGYLLKENYPDAIRELRIAKQLDEDNPVVHNHLAIALYARKRFTDSEEHFRIAIDLKNDYTEARSNLAQLLIDLKRYKEAIRELKIVVEDLTYNKPEKGYSNLALAHLSLNEFDLAKKYIDIAIGLNGSDCTSRGVLGQILYSQELYSKAASQLDSAVELCKNLDEAYYFGGLAYSRSGQMEKARARFRELISLYPGSKYIEKAKMELKKLE